MTCFVYIIGSFKANKLTTYVGWTNNIDERLNKHNSSKGAKSTKGRQWELIYYEEGRSVDFRAPRHGYGRDHHLERRC